MKRSIAVLFPGIGYTNDRSLLYFAGRLAEKAGFEVIRIRYGGFPADVKGNREKMEKSFYIALEQAKEQLKDIDWNACDRILFISKSIGTIAASAIAGEYGISADSVVFTPLEDTFRFLDGNAVVFHGTADPWADAEVIRKACTDRGIPVHTEEGANHSLETGDVIRNIEILMRTMTAVKQFIDDAGQHGPLS